MLLKEQCPLVLVLIPREWTIFILDGREVMRKDFGRGSKSQNMLNLIKDYTEKIKGLGYIPCELSDFVSFRNSKNSTLYYLIAFSKHPLGIKFWQEAKERLEKKRNRGLVPLF